jgi:hypothetical protein
VGAEECALCLICKPNGFITQQTKQKHKASSKHKINAAGEGRRVAEERERAARAWHPPEVLNLYASR